MNQGTKGYSLKKKPMGQKSHETVPLTLGFTVSEGVMKQLD
jgi:hypothetical protein